MNLADPLCINTYHADTRDYPWVTMADGVENRLLQARIDENILVLMVRAHPGASSVLHRHLGPVFGLTLKGAWGHRPEQFPFLPGHYICEPVNEVHRFHNGPGVSEIFFVYHGDVEVLDESGTEVLARGNAATSLQHYLQQCEEQGFARPNVLK